MIDKFLYKIFERLDKLIAKVNNLFINKKKKK